MSATLQGAIEPPGDRERLRVVAARLAEHVTSGTIAGGVLGVADRSGDVWIHPFGVAGTTDDPEPMRADHRFLLTSVTKPFTATQVLQLVDEGRIDLTASVAEYMPDFAVNGKERVTTQQLLSHTSGIDLVANTTEGLPTNLTADDHIQEALAASLSWDAGSWFAYNSPGFWILAELVTRLSGLRYTEHLRARVLRPLHMTSSDYEPDNDSPDRYVVARATQRGHLAEQVRRLAYPAGGLISTAADVLTFARCYLSGGKLDGVRIVSEAAIDAMSRPQVHPIYTGRPTAWGLGWQLGGPGDLRDPQTLFHWGGSGTALWIDRVNGCATVLLTASWFLDWRIYGEIINGVYGCLND